MDVELIREDCKVFLNEVAVRMRFLYEDDISIQSVCLKSLEFFVYGFKILSK